MANGHLDRTDMCMLTSCANICGVLHSKLYVSWVRVQCITLYEQVALLKPKLVKHCRSFPQQSWLWLWRTGSCIQAIEIELTDTLLLIANQRSAVSSWDIELRRHSPSLSCLLTWQHGIDDECWSYSRMDKQISWDLSQCLSTWSWHVVWHGVIRASLLLFKLHQFQSCTQHCSVAICTGPTVLQAGYKYWPELIQQPISLLVKVLCKLIPPCLPGINTLTVHWQSQADALLNLNLLELIVLQHRRQIVSTKVYQLCRF